MSNLSRSVIDALIPQGPVWEPAADDDYDLLLEGIADNSEAVRLDLEKLRYIRDPEKTSILSDLEHEYGIIPSATATEAERRQRLAFAMFRRSEKPTYENLEYQIKSAGFPGIYVHQNSPAVDPDIFLTQSFNMFCGDLLPGGNEAQCGEPEAICSRLGGELLVNGEHFDIEKVYNCLCGSYFAWYDPETHSIVESGEEVCCGNPDACCGQYNSVNMIPTLYNVPVNPGYWPLIFFVGGPATRDPVTGEITDIEIASVPIERRLEFRRIILRYKPMASWAALILVYG